MGIAPRITGILLMQFPFYHITGEQCRYIVKSVIFNLNYEIDKFQCIKWYTNLLIPKIIELAVCSAMVWWGTDKSPYQPRKICLSNVSSWSQGGLWERKRRCWMALSCCDRVQCCNSVPIVLGLCKGLGFAPNEFQEPLASEWINATAKDHLLLLHGICCGPFLYLN